MLLALALIGALFERYECARCHEGVPVEPPPASQRCVGCHQEILAGRFDAKPATLAKWQANLRSLNAVPSLAGAGALRRAWVEAFLLEPYDVRPGLPASMPRLAIDVPTAEALAKLLVPEERNEAPPGDPERGKKIYEEMGCGTCHAFGGVHPPPVEIPGALLAPDLAHTKSRVQAGRLAELIRRPSLAMPDYGLDETASNDLARFILAAGVRPTRAPAPARLPILSRKVAFEEVERRVLKKVCWHCHSSPDYARGDGGPGNTGGFGFPARGLDLSSFTALRSGVLDGGRRVSVLSAEGGTPRLLAVLLARQAEEAGRPGPLRGMPLGLPALSPEDVQLVESWLHGLR